MKMRNHFLNSLFPEDFDLLRSGLKRVVLRRDQSLVESGHAVSTAYFPIDSVLSVITVMLNGRAVESRTIGCESGFGLLHALGSDLSLECVTTQMAGEAYAIPTARLARAAAERPTLVHHIAQHAQSTIVQAAQSTGCNALHDVRQRLCKWLLLTQDRTGKDILLLTQEHLSIMLGVQRTTVTFVASQLQKAGYISYTRGRVAILDRTALERTACECYDAIKYATRALAPDQQQTRATSMAPPIPCGVGQ